MRGISVENAALYLYRLDIYARSKFVNFGTCDARQKLVADTRALHSPCDCVGDGGELWRGFHCDDNIALGGIGEIDMQISRRYGLVLCNFTFTNLLMFRYGL